MLHAAKFYHLNQPQYRALPILSDLAGKPCSFKGGGVGWGVGVTPIRQGVCPKGVPFGLAIYDHKMVRKFVVLPF